MANREIKFRAFGGNTMGIVTGFDDQFCSVKWGNDEVSCDVATEDIRLMQYTGLKDKNGKEIYEGDIVEAPHCGKEVVTFGHPYNAAFCVGNIMLGVIDYTDIEIIGNVYENPALIKRKITSPV